ncbi:hypothetical protein BWI96_06515 [Siphonobacter sp. SORGH_AS_0500]|uniref:hydroxymethylpyrimidine/phosphomethylpyrimidine kinase n=1 Tax=Siphonobacter sp. SORGH_AS_0500 TaxID=1864824 RepID=UPI000CA748ED|nr:hydroxymethylpyrimidine/phosphomethylpyrimidine kinase [Siphonobacter sp. SORGH_AS_0500]PKK37512.1 hypothetical protein BWI96_06515 [Siphonobacter sp. SORGH_AS_0500]
MIQTERPYVLSIAGLDPSAGAGILADVKVFEAQQTYGLAVATALTIQHDASFRKVHWVSLEEIIAQCEPLFERYPIQVVKIGLIESMSVLSGLLDWLVLQNPKIILLWDPILKASAGFDFHRLTLNELVPILQKLTVITPNIPEIQQITGEQDPQKAAQTLSNYCNVYLKGGHSSSENGQVTDYLFDIHQTVIAYPAPFIPNGEKHGSGCVLSAVLATGLAKGFSQKEASARARLYMDRYLASTPYLLGFHETIV